MLLLLSTSVAGKLRITKERADQIRKEAKTWVPYDYENHPFRDVDDVSKMTGLIIDEGNNSGGHSPTHLMGKLLSALKTAVKPLSKFSQLSHSLKAGNPIYKDHARHTLLGLPLYFDARTEWPGCIGAVKDQASCGSCYAFSAASMLEDRFCIKSEGQISVELAPEDIITCDTNNYGCSGGLLSLSIDFLITEGLTT